MKHRKTKCAGVTMMSLLFLAAMTFAQTPTASVKVQGYSPQEIHDLGWPGPKSSGLSNVGIGQVVYLVGSDEGGAEVTTYAWSIASAPTGSNAALDSSDTWQVTFRPDLVGAYMIELVVTTAGGTSEAASIRISAGKFVGVGGMDGLPTDVAQGQCSLCHNTNFQQWTKTGHSTKFTREISGLGSAHYQERCNECHTTGYDTTSTALGNDGFFAVQQELGWVFPATLEPANWTDIKTNYTKLAHRANIQCEACHGPGSQHKGNKANIAMTIDEAACAQCHDEEPYHNTVIQWKNSRHGNPQTDRSTSGSCARCHSGWGFVTRIDVITNDTRPTLGVNQVTCAVCHDPHDAELPSQVRSLSDVTLGDEKTVVDYGGMGKLCMQCHTGRRNAEEYASEEGNISTHFGPHYSAQADMIDGSNAIDYGIPIGTSGHKFAVENACVTCHMQPTPAEGPAKDKVGEHTYAVRWDNDTPDDPSDDFEHVAACQNCHGPIQSFDDIMAKADFDKDGTIEGTRHEIEGMLHNLGMLLPPVGDPEVMSTSASLEEYKWSAPGLTPEQVAYRQALTKAAFNYKFVEEDRSHGVHNAGYAFALLSRSIESVTTGDVGAANIISITDVPNDQGKQVRVAWYKFPGDGLSANPLTNYTVWRRVDDATNGSVGKSNIVQSREELGSLVDEGDLGKRFTVANDGQWDFVGWLPAAGREVYSAVVPTLFDSTAAGMHMSYFFVAGHAVSQNYETAADSGYSVDNLAPSTPSSIAMGVAAKSVNFQWDDPIDPDFRYFAVYRSESSGFDPNAVEPLATLINTEFNDENVEVGKDYFYRFSAFDFAGNESAFSEELTATITSIGSAEAVPTEYALLQNYPNPFNPSTTIEYQLPEAGKVRLTVFNVLGAPVRTLVDRDQAAGSFKITWDARDNAGSLVPSGVYFYRVESGTFAEMKKMILMK